MAGVAYLLMLTLDGALLAAAFAAQALALGTLAARSRDEVAACGGAGLWQRMPPRPLPDLRTAPPAIR